MAYFAGKPVDFREAAIYLFEAAQSTITFFRGLDVDAPDWDKVEDVLQRLKGEVVTFEAVLDATEPATTPTIDTERVRELEEEFGHHG